MRTSTRDQLAKWIIYIFLGVTALMMVSVMLGVSQWDAVQDMLEKWSATYSFLVGAVIGYYFKQPEEEKKTRARAEARHAG